MRLFTLYLLLGVIALQAQTSSTTGQQLETALQQQQRELPQEQLYVQTDRSLYYPGEVVWLSAYLVGNDNTTAAAQSDMVHVELLRPSGTALTTTSIPRNAGAFTADLQLPSDLPGGTYTLRAYTNYQGNFGSRYIYTKTIQVQRSVIPQLLLKLDIERETYAPGDEVQAFFSARDLQDTPLQAVAIEYQLRVAGQVHESYTLATNQVGSAQLRATLPDDINTQDVQLSVRLQYNGKQEQISRPVGIALNNITLKLLPEGGEWIEGLDCQMAFIAKDEFGEPADVSGTLYDADDQEVLKFKSLHDGMGKFTIAASVKPPCRVRLDQPIAGQRVYPLPDPVAGSWQINTQYDQGDELVLHADALQAEELQIALRAGGQLHDCLVWSLEEGKQQLGIDVSGLPMGIAQLTVFDQQLRPVWERLVFLHPNHQLQVEISSDKEQYSFRDQVHLDIEVSDDRGKPVAGLFSLAVSDDRLHSFVDDKQPNILAQLLLSGELSGKIHEPNYYFDPQEADALAALDVLMLTHGWRRFHWRELLQRQASDWQAMLQHPVESVQLTGHIRFAGRSLRNQKIKVRGVESLEVETTKQGYFSVPPRIMQGENLLVEYRGFTQEATLYHGGPLAVKNRFSPAAAEERAQGLLLTEALPKELDPSSQELKETLVLAKPKESLMDGEQLLDEVVVVGRDVTRRKDLSSSISVIRRDWDQQTLTSHDLDMELDMEEEVPTIAIHSSRSLELPVIREFAFPQYHNPWMKMREMIDQRKTLYWNGRLRTNTQGKAEVAFYTADEMTTYRVILEGLGTSAHPAYGAHTFSAAPAIGVEYQLPVYATTGDTILAPIVVHNNTNTHKDIPLTVDIQGDGLQWLTPIPKQLSVEGGRFKTVQAQLLVVGQAEDIKLKITAGERHWRTQTQRELEIHPVGFPRQASASAQKMQSRYNLDITDPIPGTVKAKLQLFPKLTDDLLAGVDAILREPHGCFEQTSSSNYPNIMALQYLQEQDQLDDATRTRAWELLERGYERLSGYEVSTGGFSLWGKPPAVPVLSAFGLLQFSDLSEVWPKVDPALIPRTIEYLVSTYEKNRITSDVDRAYILYALSRCSDYRSQTGLDEINQILRKKKTPYLLGIAAHLNLLYGNRPLAKEQIDQLLAIFEDNAFSQASQSPTFVHTVGAALSVELMAWTVLAALEYDNHTYDLKPVMDVLISKRHGGRFGPTQPTVMALKAITAYEKAEARPDENGMLLVAINQGQTDTLHYGPEQDGSLTLTGLEKYLQAGNNYIDIRYLGTEHPLPYNLDIYWQTDELPTLQDGNVALETKLQQSDIQLSDQVRYEVQLENLNAEEGYAPMIQLALPAGLQWQLWQLKEMTEQGKIDYYEMHGPYLVLYFGKIAARETLKLDFDLIAVAPGHYQAPAASAYLYYQDHAKSWVPGIDIQIRP